MKILITAPSLNPAKNVSGISTVVQTIISHNEQHQYFHYLLGRPDKKLSKMKWLFELVKQVLLFPVALKRNKIDLVHQNLPFDPKGLIREYVINLWARLFNVPVFLHVHGGMFLMNGTDSIFFRFLAKQLFKNNKMVVVLSELEKDALVRQYQYHQAQVLMNSIDVNQFASLGKKVEKAKPAFLFLGRIHESKGIDDTIEAFRILKKEFEFRFILCGDGPSRALFVALCTKILGDDFEYRGVVSGDEKLKVIADSDFFLLPSRYGEGLPMALLETMAAGLVPIVTDDASMKFVVIPNKNGIRVNKKDPNSIVKEIQNVLNNLELFKSLSANAIKTVEDNYDIKKYIKKLNELYNVIYNKK